MNFEGTIRYQLTAEEIVTGWLKHRNHSKYWRSKITPIIVGALLTIYGALYERPPGFFFFGALAITLIAVLLCALAPWQMRRHYLKGIYDHPGHIESKEVAFGKDGLMITSPTGKVSFTWSKVKKLSEDTRYFYLHASRNGLVMLLPKRSFDAEGEKTFRRCSQSILRT